MEAALDRIDCAGFCAACLADVRFLRESCQCSSPDEGNPLVTKTVIRRYRFASLMRLSFRVGDLRSDKTRRRKLSVYPMLSEELWT